MGNYSSLASALGVPVTNQSFISPTPLDESFHTYTLDWTPTNLTITLDHQYVVLDHKIQSNLLPPRNPPAPFDGDFFLNLMQGFGVSPNSLQPTTPIPATTQVDWVRVWG